MKIGPAVYASMYFSAASLRPQGAQASLRSTLTRKTAEPQKQRRRKAAAAKGWLTRFAPSIVRLP